MNTMPDAAEPGDVNDESQMSKPTNDVGQVVKGSSTLYKSSKMDQNPNSTGDQGLTQMKK